MRLENEQLSIIHSKMTKNLSLSVLGIIMGENIGWSEVGGITVDAPKNINFVPTSNWAPHN